MKNRKLFSAMLLMSVGSVMSGCGGNDNTSDIEDPISQDEVQETKIINAKIIGSIPEEQGTTALIFFGKYDVERFYYGNKDINNDGMLDNPWTEQSELGGASFDIDLTDPQLKQTRPEIFATGSYSILDILNFMSDTRDDLEITTEYSEELDTYLLKTSWDEDGDGTFDYVNDPNFYATAEYSDDDSLSKAGQALYSRLDKFLVKNDTRIRFRPYSAAITERREASQASEMARAPATRDDGKFIIPTVTIQAADETFVFTDVEVTAHDLRLDRFQSGVITHADILLSMADQPGKYSSILPIEYTVWPTLISGVVMNSYMISSIAGSTSGMDFGWNTSAHNSAFSNDFYFWPVLRGGTAPSTNPDNPMYINKAPWKNYGDGVVIGQDEQGNDLYDNMAWRTTDTEDDSYSDWYDFVNNGFWSENYIHIATDLRVINNNPPSDVIYKYGSGMANLLDFDGDADLSPALVSIVDYTLYISDVSEPLKETHFGWGYADCAMCHTLEGIHSKSDIGGLGVDVLDQSAVPTGEVVMAPYICAECHGSNGAPKAHGETGWCNWCHNSFTKLKWHGDATNADPYDFDEDGYNGVVTPQHSEAIATAFPDPISCGTCHPNE